MFSDIPLVLLCACVRVGGRVKDTRRSVWNGQLVTAAFYRVICLMKVAEADNWVR